VGTVRYDFLFVSHSICVIYRFPGSAGYRYYYTFYSQHVVSNAAGMGNVVEILTQFPSEKHKDLAFYVQAL